MRPMLALTSFTFDPIALAVATRARPLGDDAPPGTTTEQPSLDDLRRQTRIAQVLHAAGHFPRAVEVQREVLLALDPDDALAGHGTVNLGIYQASRGHVVTAERVLKALEDRRSNSACVDDEWDRVWLRASQLKAVLLSARGQQQQARACQQAVVEGLAVVVGHEHVETLHARVVLAGIDLLLGEYGRAKDAALAIERECIALGWSAPALLLPAVVEALANFGLDRFHEASIPLLRRISALSFDEQSTPLGVLAMFLGYCAASNMPDPPTDSNPLDVDEFIRRPLLAIKAMLGPCDITTVAQLAYAETLIGYELYNDSKAVIGQVLDSFFDVAKKRCGIEYEWQAWAASLSLGVLVDSGRDEDALRLSEAIREFAVDGCTEDSVPALRASIECLAPLQAAGRINDALDHLQYVLDRSSRECGDLHPLTLETAAAVLQARAAAIIEGSDRDEHMRSADELINRFDQPVFDRREEFGYARVNRGVLSWEVAKVTFLSHVGRTAESVAVWWPVRELARETFGVTSNYARMYRLFDDLMWQIRDDLP